MSEPVKPEELATLGGRLDKVRAELSGEIKTIQTSVQLGFQGLRDQMAALALSLQKRDTDCKDCKDGQKLINEDHEARLRTLEAWKNKSIGGLIVLGGTGGLVGAIVALLVQWLMGVVAK